MEASVDEKQIMPQCRGKGGVTGCLKNGLDACRRMAARSIDDCSEEGLSTPGTHHSPSLNNTVTGDHRKVRGLSGKDNKVKETSSGQHGALGMLTPNT